MTTCTAYAGDRAGCTFVFLACIGRVHASLGNHGNVCPVLACPKGTEMETLCHLGICYLPQGTANKPLKETDFSGFIFLHGSLSNETLNRKNCLKTLCHPLFHRSQNPSGDGPRPAKRTCRSFPEKASFLNMVQKTHIVRKTTAMKISLHVCGFLLK